MVHKYKVSFTNGSCLGANTCNSINIKLVGTDGESENAEMSHSLLFLVRGYAYFVMSCSKSLGKLVQIELQKVAILKESDWFPANVTVRSPEGQTYYFPIYHWITDDQVYVFREGKALKASDENLDKCKDVREKELIKRREAYCWDTFKDGLPHCLKADDPQDLPGEVRFSFTKETQFFITAIEGLIHQVLTERKGIHEKWSNFEDFNHVFGFTTTKISEHVQKNWDRDEFFGYQYLNGSNPTLIQRCRKLPENFPVTDEMVSLYDHHSLTDEMESGNIFLCDYKVLDGVRPNVIESIQQHLTAPLVLLHKNPDDELKPVAIQLKQQPGKTNPIFTQCDEKYDWLLAKIFVRSADFSEHQLNAHLLRTHLLAEVFAVSLLRNIPMVHPLYKLLIPHMRYTLHINVLARQKLISDDGVFSLIAAVGGEGMAKVLKKSLSSVTYRSLCIPDDIVDRGMETIPNYYYRDDGLKLWGIINRLVKTILKHYYKNKEVNDDTELQMWISDIFKHGFLSNTSTGIPDRFSTVAELIKFVTMVIFTVSAQHAAVNSGQFDYGGYMPNNPVTLQHPPPTQKGKVSEKTLFMTFPEILPTVKGMETLWLLSKQSSDFVPLGEYPEEHFSEEAPCKAIEKFKNDLKHLSSAIEKRNKSLDVPYTYLNPLKVENSVAI